MKKTAALLLVSFLFASAAYAEEYTVVPGDTLSKIAKQFGVSVQQLKAKNGLHADTIYAGQKLSIPDRNDTSIKLKRTVTINAENVRLRDAGDPHANILATLKKGTKAELLEFGKKWSKVRIGNVVGYVYTPYIDVADAAPASSRSLDLLAYRIKNIVTPLVGTPYKYGGTSPEGFDCSGFTKYVMGKLGVNLPRVSADQFHVGTAVERNDLQVGDLLFFDTYRSGRISHVGIYIGDNKMAHASSKAVTISDLDWYFNNYPFFGAKRVLPVSGD